MSHDDLPYCGECGVSHDPVCGPGEPSPFAVTDSVLHPDPEVIFPSDSGGGGF